MNAAKFTMNGISESKRREISPQKFLYYSNARVVFQDKYYEEITIAVNKPIAPSPSMLGNPGYYNVGDFQPNMLNEKKKTIVEEKREAAEKIRIIRNFYIEKGVNDKDTLDLLVHNATNLRKGGGLDRWWYGIKKRNFMELMEDYKYPLT